MTDLLEFQLYDWLEGHEEVETEDDENPNLGDFIIHAFGRMEDGKSVYAKITDYTPYFYYLLPNKLQNKQKSVLEVIVKKMEQFMKSKDNNKVYYKYKVTLKEIQLIKLKIAEGFTNDKEFYFARMVFSNADGMKKFKSYLENNEITFTNITELSTKAIKLKLYEANLPPMLRCFHIRDISGCAWVGTTNYELVDDEDEKVSRCDIEINVDWRNLNPVTKDKNAPFRICSFDIECNSIDGEFPQARRPGDAVIQIGATYTYIGQSVPYRQYIGCLKQTSPIENVIVESFEKEQELMLGFLEEINNNDCDIITGYNMFYFDEKYMYDRCKNILKIDHLMSNMSKLKNHNCNFKEMKLASSALGENLLRFWETPGRVHIDLMKDVQKTYNLPSYKLDYVASRYIRGEVTSYQVLENERFELTCKSVNDINVGDYIHLEVIHGFVSDEVGEKYFVIDINTQDKTIIVKGDEFLKSELDTAKQGGLINWSQAKDDVGPKDIFRLQKGSPDDRAIVAKYCVKDCKLVNLLINKLEIVTKNIEMSNVCYVPLSYLFIRGQGIKLFSLCLREFRKQKYAFPVLKLDKLYRCSTCSHEYLNVWQCPRCRSKNRTEVETESSSYEGAIVFDPVPKVDYEALATKDYMSLYPASIIHKNMSHETMIEDPDYDNLPGITYFNAQFKESDGSIEYRRFAKVDNKLGVIPSILDNLLKTRKTIKKQMAKETDPFKSKILDAKQLAVKVTANSLYGQLGAPTSQVCKRDIAACTTSTGREMLILAKRYDEEFLPWIMNGLKSFYNNNEMDKVERLLDLELKNRNDTKLIEEIKEYVTKGLDNLTFQPVIRYGDSVIGKTPLLLRNSKTKNIFIESIDNLGDNYVLMADRNNGQNKECSELKDIETWTEKGWTKVQRVIRHKLAKDKKLFRITTHVGCVVATDDHSLLTTEGKEISPKDVKIGTKLLHSFPEINNNKDYTFFNSVELNIELAQFLGMFMGDGSCGFYNCKSGDKASFALNNQNMEIINKYKDIGNKYFTDFEWVCLNTLKSSSVYKLVPKNKKDSYGKLKKFICEIRILMYTNDSQKKVPEFIINASREIREAFFIGLYDADGYKTNRGQICEDLYDKNLSKPITDKIRCGSQIDQKGMVAAMGIYTLGKSLGYEASINNRKDKINIFRIRFSPKIRKDPDAIKKIEEWILDEEYVYDLTTNNHHFQAGVGSMIVHNTDSIFSCYRFRENTTLFSCVDGLKIWKRIVNFGKILIEPYLAENEKKIFVEEFDKHYSEDKITSLELPEGPKCLPEPTHHNIILPIEERIKQFLKEYMQESYLPWLWTLSELVEKNYTNMFDIKLGLWAEHQLSKIRLNAENLSENRKNFLLKNIIEYLDLILNNKYRDLTDEELSHIANILKTCDSGIKKDKDRIITMFKTFMERKVKDKWIYSGEKKELTKLVTQYIQQVQHVQHVSLKETNEKFSCYLTEYLLTNKNNKNFDVEKSSELLIKNLLAEEEYKCDENKLKEFTLDFIENYNKMFGKKTLEELLEEFMSKDLELDFDLYKKLHYNKVIDFVNKYMREENMTKMNNTYDYYWVQPRWDFSGTKLEKKIYKVDIYKGGQAITDKRTLEKGMQLGILSGELIKSRLPFPHDCEYEKTFWPFAILTKKRYVGNKYEYDPKKYKQDFMGIVLKRRDNAPIVKEICGGIIDFLINHRDPEGAKKYVRKCLQDMFDGKYDIKYFLQSRNMKMKESYADWTKIAHVYLAEKIAKRDPGNAPQSGDRIEFVVIKVPPPAKGEKLLQGDIIEIPSYIKEKKLQIDYLFYLTNQIMTPALQFLNLVDNNAIEIFNDFIKVHSESYAMKEQVKQEREQKKHEKETEKQERMKKRIEIKTKKEEDNKIKVKKVVKQNPIQVDDTHEKIDYNNMGEETIKAQNLLFELYTNSKSSSKIKPNLKFEIRKLIDEINEYLDSNKSNYNNSHMKVMDEIFMSLNHESY